MTDSAALLQAIYEAPDGDAPRRAYAEWLIERGDPRGELVSLQLEEQRTGLTEAQTERVAALLRQHGDQWLGALAPVVMFREGVVFERGFPSTSYVSFKTTEQCRAVLEAPEMATLRGLTIMGFDVPGTRVLAYLAGRDRPSRLRYLAIELGAEPDGEDLVALTHPRAVVALPELATLWVNATRAESPVTPEALGWVTRGPLLSQLERLVVTGLAEARSFRLAAWLQVAEGAPQLRVLDLMRTAKDVSGVTTTWWWQLRRDADGAEIEISLSVDPQYEAASRREVDARLAEEHARAFATDLEGLGALGSLRLACSRQLDVDADAASSPCDPPGPSDTPPSSRDYATALVAKMQRHFAAVRLASGGPLR